jgi:O-antigen/teichoic acid export membrane protein
MILVNILFVGFGSLSVGSLINSQGKTRISFIAGLIYVCVGLPMGLYMIPNYGIVGLLLTSILASKPSLIYALWWIRKNFGFSVNWASSAKIYISSGLSFIVVYVLLLLFSFGDWIDLILGVGVFFVIYSILLPSIGALDRYDIMNLRSIMKALGPLAPLFNMFLGIIARFTRETKGA